MGVRHPEYVLVAALIVSLPMLPSFIDGAVGPLDALVRFAIALVVCWAVYAVAERVYDNYERQARERAIKARLEEIRRRAEESASSQGGDGVAG